MVLEKDLRGKVSQISGLKEGLKDILEVMQEQQEKWGESALTEKGDGVSSQKDAKSLHNSEKASELEDEDGPGVVVQTVIGKIFDQHRHYQAQLSDLQHALQMKMLQLEDLESLRLDLEILNEEKDLTQADLNSMKSQLDVVHQQLIQKQRELAECASQRQADRSEAERRTDELRMEMQRQNEEEAGQVQRSWQTKI